MKDIRMEPTIVIGKDNIILIGFPFPFGIKDTLITWPGTPICIGSPLI